MNRIDAIMNKKLIKQVDELRRQIENLKAGKNAAPEAADLTDERGAVTAEDYLQRVRLEDGGYDEDGLRSVIDALIASSNFTQGALEELQFMRDSSAQPDLSVRSEAQEPFAYFQQHTTSGIWEEVIPSAAGERGVVAAYRMPVSAESGKDAGRLNAIAENYWNLESFDMPTGGGDADVGWRVSQFHEGEALPRTVAEVYKDDPRAAIDAAIQKNGGKA